MENDEKVIYANDIYADEANASWTVAAVDVVNKTVRVRMVVPPEQSVSFAEFGRRFTNRRIASEKHWKAFEEAGKAAKTDERREDDDQPSERAP